MTALAEEWQLADQHALVVRAVRVVAGHAAFGDRRVLPQVRAALVGMAALAAFVDGGAGLEQTDIAAAVRVVTGAALHGPFAHRHVTEPIVLVHHRLVTDRAGLHL